MRIFDMLGKITDKKLYIELINNGNDNSLGIYTKEESEHSEFYDSGILKVNFQYRDNKRIMQIWIWL